MRLIFLVGAPRSGTTLLQNLIACHPDVASAPETHFFVHATPALLYERNLPPICKRRLPDRIEPKSAERLVARLAAAMKRNGLDTAAFESNFAGDGIRTRDLANRFFASQADGAAIFLEKSPPHVFFVPEIRDVYPDAKIVNIVRDPRDVVASINEMLDRQGKSGRTVFERARVWSASVNAAQRHDLFTVRYEDLVLNRDEVLRSVFGHLDLDYRERHFENYGAVASQTARENETWKQNNREPVSDAMIGKFRERMTEAEAGMVESLCGRLMKSWDYERTGVGYRRATLLSDGCAYYGMRFKHLVSALLTSERYA